MRLFFFHFFNDDTTDDTTPMRHLISAAPPAVTVDCPGGQTKVYWFQAPSPDENPSPVHSTHQFVDDVAKGLNKFFELGPLFRVEIQQFGDLNAATADECRARTIVNDEAEEHRT